ncbi:MAG: hypothetical protein H6700_02675 [Myxococcales bacterium]|nr:hypothetical protein [Myxococcales bacterium]
MGATERWDSWSCERLQDTGARLGVTWIRDRMLSDRGAELVEWRVRDVGTHLAALAARLTHTGESSAAHERLMAVAAIWFQELVRRSNAKLAVGGDDTCPDESSIPSA